MAHRIHVRPLSLAALSALCCVIADISTSAARYGPKVSAARRWSAHLVAVDVRARRTQAPTLVVNHFIVPAKRWTSRRLSDTVACRGRATRTVRSGRVALQGCISDW